jgi:hypothetical protein
LSPFWLSLHGGHFFYLSPCATYRAHLRDFSGEFFGDFSGEFFGDFSGEFFGDFSDDSVCLFLPLYIYYGKKK